MRRSPRGITDDHVDVARLGRETREDAFDDDEAELVGWATTKRYAAFRCKVRYWSDQVDPDGTDQRAKDQQTAAEWHASTSFQDEVFVSGRLDPVGGSIYAASSSGSPRLAVRTGMGRRPPPASG